MQTERPPTEGPSTRSNPARGIVLLAAAVVLGLFLLRAIDDSSSSDDISTATTDTTAANGEATDTTAAEDGGDTTTTAPLRQPAEIVVRVANVSGVSGAAGAKTEQLAAAGYQTVEATNGPEGQQLDATQVLFVDGFQGEAVALAEALGAPADGVAAMPAQPPADPGGAQLVVMLGTDLAGG
ncbi:MAG: LytR C-terminal domain-containing protein [Candidatus Limnocylindrales bacterium]